MSDGILSQDEIDALLGSANDGGNELDVDAVAEMVRVALEASVEGLGDLLKVKAGLAPLRVQEVTFGEAISQAEGPLFAVEAELGGPFVGGLVFLFPSAAVAGLGGMMLGAGPGEAELSEESLGGFREAMAEVASQLGSAFSTILAAQIDVVLSDPIDLETGMPRAVGTEDRVVETAYTMSVGDLKVETIVCIPSELSDRLLAAISAQIDADESLDAAAAAEPVESDPQPVVSGFDDFDDPPAPRVRSAAGDAGDDEVQVGTAEFQSLRRERSSPERGNIDLLLDVPLQVTVELGRTRMQIREILELGKGSVVELDKLAGEPVEIFVNGKLIAKGEVVTIDENFGVKITDIVSRRERVTHLH